MKIPMLCAAGSLLTVLLSVPALGGVKVGLADANGVHGSVGRGATLRDGLLPVDLDVLLAATT